MGTSSTPSKPTAMVPPIPYNCQTASQAAGERNPYGVCARADASEWPSPRHPSAYSSAPGWLTKDSGHNIEWRAVLSLLDAVASVEEQRDGRFLVTLGEETETLERPRDKDIDLQQVVDLRRMLRNAGYGSEVEDIGT